QQAAIDAEVGEREVHGNKEREREREEIWRGRRAPIRAPSCWGAICSSGGLDPVVSSSSTTARPDRISPSQCTEIYQIRRRVQKRNLSCVVFITVLQRGLRVGAAARLPVHRSSLLAALFTIAMIIMIAADRHINVYWHPLYPRRRGLTANTRYESAKIYPTAYRCQPDGNLTRARTLWLDQRNRHSRSAPNTALSIYTVQLAHSGQPHRLSEIRRWHSGASVALVAKLACRIKIGSGAAQTDECKSRCIFQFTICSCRNISAARSNVGCCIRCLYMPCRDYNAPIFRCMNSATCAHTVAASALVLNDIRCEMRTTTITTTSRVEGGLKCPSESSGRSAAARAERATKKVEEKKGPRKRERERDQINKSTRDRMKLHESIDIRREHTTELNAIAPLLPSSRLNLRLCVSTLLTRTHTYTRIPSFVSCRCPAEYTRRVA
ncbi:unnamed protein product, partial [Trichogramma brassicae]